MNELEDHALEVVRQNAGTPWEDALGSPIYDAACGRYLNYLLACADSVEMRAPTMGTGTMKVSLRGKMQTFADAGWGARWPWRRSAAGRR